jgi:enoyl reductase-like protein
MERRAETEHHYLLDLIEVLLPHPAGLRRWAIMRAMRKIHQSAERPISQKFEDEIERVFRNHCGDSANFKKRKFPPEKALFHWPQGKAAGLWAVYPDKAEAFLKSEDRDFFLNMKPDDKEF